MWKFYTVPGNPAKWPRRRGIGQCHGNGRQDLERATGGKTGGGGTPWDGIVYDPQTDLVIFGTGNGAPWPSEMRSPGGGDNLFISSIVAVEAKTGKYKWHYQTVPAENFDFDNTSPLTTADLVINGEKKHVVMQAPKNGMFYVIEAGSGKVLSAKLVVPFANWLTGVRQGQQLAASNQPRGQHRRDRQGLVHRAVPDARVVSAVLQSQHRPHVLRRSVRHVRDGVRGGREDGQSAPGDQRREEA